MLVRVAAVCGIVLIASASVVPIDEVTITTRAVDQLDDNRFFTRVGGTLLGITDYAGLEPGQPYTLSSQLVDRDTGALVGDPVFDTFTAAASTGTETVELEIAPNRTESNIYLALVQVLYDGEVSAQDNAKRRCSPPRRTSTTSTRRSRCTPSSRSPSRRSTPQTATPPCLRRAARSWRRWTTRTSSRATPTPSVVSC